MLKIARYRFTFRMTAPLRLPDYAGSALRGAFGHALMHVSGINSSDIKEKNALYLNSPYAEIFAPHDIPRASSGFYLKNQIPVPFVIEAPIQKARNYLLGDTLQYEMVLIGEALTQLATVILAWRRAFLRGIGNGGTAELVSVAQLSSNGEQVIYSEFEPFITAHNTVVNCPQYTAAQNVHLKLLTPLRISQRGKVLGPRDLTASIFLRHLIRRVSLQVQAQNPSAFTLDKIRYLNSLADTVQDERRLQWQDWQRYSSRQKQAIDQGGVVGRGYFESLPAELLPIIYLGEWLHFGKETAMGLGWYKWTDEPWAPAPFTAAK